MSPIKQPGKATTKRARKPVGKPAKAPQKAPPLQKAAILESVRALCLSFPEASERPSHGAPAFFIRGKHTFVMWADNHHGDGRLALWCAAPEGAQAMLVDSEPDHYFVPPYVGPSGWIGVRLDRNAKWAEVSSVIENAYLTRAPAKLAAAFRAQNTID